MKYDFSGRKASGGTQVRSGRWFPFSRGVSKLLGTVAILLIALSLSLGGVWLVLMKAASSVQTGVVGIVIVSTLPDDPRASLTVAVIDGDRQQVQVLAVPDNLQFSAKAYGVFPASATYGLFGLDNASTDTFTLFVSRMLSIESTQIIQTRQPPPTSKSAFVAILQEAAIMPSGSSLSRVQALRLWAFTRSLGSEKIRLLQLPLAVTLPAEDNPSLLMLDRVAYDRWAEGLFLRRDIRGEGHSVAIVNASGVQRAATTFGRFLASIGYVVIAVSDTPDEVQKGSVALSSSAVEQSVSVQSLQRMFPGSIAVNPTAATQMRADIVITIGKDDVTFLSL